jgi:hypothetical protein
LNDQSYLQALTVECIEEFAEGPAEFVQEMEEYYEALQMGAFDANERDQDNQGITPNNDQPSRNGQSPVTNGWKSSLSGGVLYFTATQSNGGIFVQTTQYMHLCPNGTANLYQNSGGGGGAITAPAQMEYTGSIRWDVIERGNQAYFQIDAGSGGQLLPMSLVNNKIIIQNLGNFSFEPGAAACY